MGREPHSVPPGAPPPDVRAARPGFGLSRARRMCPALYRETFALDRSFPGRYLVLFLRTAPDAGRRLGVVTSRRALPSAVARTRARRLLRETFRLLRPHLRPDADVLLLARARIDGARRPEVDADFRTVCRKAGIWQEAAC
jgi:ribonuclease P protein component